MPGPNFRLFPRDHQVSRAREFKNLRAAARTPEDFHSLAAYCECQADRWRQYLQQCEKTHERGVEWESPPVMNDVRTMVDCWTKLKQSCIDLARRH